MERRFLPGQRQLRVAFAEREKVPLVSMAGKEAKQGDQREGCNEDGHFLGTQNGNFLTFLFIINSVAFFLVYGTNGQNMRICTTSTCFCLFLLFSSFKSRGFVPNKRWIWTPTGWMAWSLAVQIIQSLLFRWVLKSVFPKFEFWFS